MHYFYAASSRNELEGVVALWANKLTLRKKHFLVLEKYVEDVKQEEKHVPDLLEAIMRLPGLVKNELRQILFKMTKFRPEIIKIVVCTCQMSGKSQIRPRPAPEHPFLLYLAALAFKYFKK